MAQRPKERTYKKHVTLPTGGILPEDTAEGQQPQNAREKKDKNTSLADMLQETLSAWQQQQQQQGHWKSPKKKQQRQTHTTQPPESGLLSTLEAILQQCRQRQDDDNAVAEAIQHALQTHSDSDQTGQKDTKNDNSWYKKEGSWSKKWEDWDQQWWQWYDRTNTWDTPHHTHDEGSTQDLPTASIQELRFQEWTMRPVLLHLQTLKKGLTTGEKVDGNIIHLSTPQQVVEAQSLWAAYNLSGQVTFWLTDSAKDTPGAYHTRATCTRKHQRPRLENISLLEAAKGGRGPWTHPTCPNPTKLSKVDTSHCCACHCTKPFQSTWRHKREWQTARYHVVPGHHGPRVNHFNDHRGPLVVRNSQAEQVLTHSCKKSHPTWQKR